MKLYQIADEYETLMDIASGDVSGFTEDEVENIVKRLENIHGDFDSKVENVIHVIKNLEAQANAIKEARTHFQKKEKTISNQINNLKDYVKHNMEKLDRKKIETTYFKVSIRNNKESLVVNNLQEAIKLLPPDCIKEETIISIDKNAVKDLLSKGNKAAQEAKVKNFIDIKINKSLQIK